MPEYCTCGAKLPEDARFCHKCGKPQYDYPGLVEEAPPVPPPLPVAAPPPPPPEISFHNRLAVRIGFVIALLAMMPFMLLLALPMVPSVVAFFAGFLAVFAYCRLSGQSLSIRSGARMGWITGVFSFTIITCIMTVAIVAIASQGKFQDLLHQYQGQMHLTAEQMDVLTKVLNDPAGLVAGLIGMLLMLFVMLTGFPMLGGALGAKVLAKQ